MVIFIPRNRLLPDRQRKLDNQNREKKNKSCSDNDSTPPGLWPQRSSCDRKYQVTGATSLAAILTAGRAQEIFLFPVQELVQCAPMSTAPVSYDKSDPIIDRLEDQINWYDAKSSKLQKAYKRIKVVEIVAAALIPFLAALHISETNPQPHTILGVPLSIGTVTAMLGVLITILEGVLQLGQYQQNWVTYRATCEALKHEKFTYIAKAGVYASAADPRALLAERVETIGSQENSKWASLQQPQKSKSGEGQ
jgi:hypothetical protein